MFDRSDYVDLLKRKQAESVSRNEHLLKQLIHSAVSAEKLTGNPEWDRYLSAIEGMTTPLREAADQHRRKILGSSVVSHEELLREKLELARAEAAIEALEAAVSLPGDLSEAGSKARELLERHGIEQEAA